MTDLLWQFKIVDLKCVILQSPEDFHPGGDGQTLWVSTACVHVVWHGGEVSNLSPICSTYSSSQGQILSEDEIVNVPLLHILHIC